MSEYCKAKSRRFRKGKYEIDIIFDVSILEVFADDGLNTLTLVVYPDSPYTKIRTEGDIELKIYPIE